MHSLFFKIAVLISVGVFIACCGKQQDTPPEITVDRSECARCKMLISDGRYAAALKVEEKYLLFDDIGCMLSYARDKKITPDRALWVRDHNTDSWISAEQASFYLQNTPQTPMEYGYIAVKETDTKPSSKSGDVTPIGALAELRADFSDRFSAQKQ
jgi:copper chaperone NosL